MARLTLNGMYQYDDTLFDGMILPEGYNRDALFAEIMTRSGQLYPYHQVPSILKSNIRLWFARNYLNFDRTMDALTAEYNPIENYNRQEFSTTTPNLTDKSTLSGKDSTQASGSDSVQLSGSDSVQLSGSDSVQLSGSDSVQASGNDVTTHSGTDTTTREYDEYKETVTYSGDDTRETQVSAFDSSSYQPSEKVTDSRSNREDEKEIAGSYSDETVNGHVITLANGKKDTTTFGRKDTTTFGRKDTTTFGRKDTTTFGRKDETTFGKVDTVTHTGTESFSSHIHGNIGVTTSQQMIESELELRKIDIYDDIAARFEREFLVQVY